MTRISCVLFDLDGVLVDATEWHYVALNRALALFGFDITRYEHLSDYNGLPTRQKLQMLSVEKGLPRALHHMLSRLKQVYTRDEILTRCRPVFEKEYMLSRLRKEGYRMAVCSNSIRESLRMMVQQSGLETYFEFLVSNEDVSRPLVLAYGPGDRVGHRQRLRLFPRPLSDSPRLPRRQRLCAVGATATRH